MKSIIRCTKTNEYYLCNDDNSEKFKVAKLIYDKLRDEEKLKDIHPPDPNKFKGITQDMIDDAPTESIKNSLTRVQEMRDEWINGDVEDKFSFEYNKYLYKLFLESEGGINSSAYHLLSQLGLIEVIEDYKTL